MRFSAWFVLAAFAVARLASAAELVPAEAVPLPLNVEGTKVVDSEGRPVRLRGVNAAGLEWSTNGEGHILQTVRVAVRDWQVNHVRLPLSQDRWFGKAPDQADAGASYRALVKQVVDEVAGAGAYVILDLHWSDAGEWGRRIGQHKMPDRHSAEFWADLVPAYKDHPAVLFDLYNEPHDVSWDVWLRGGPVSENDSKAKGEVRYDAVGMQTLLDTVRATGARNVVVAGGLDWSYDLSGVLNGRRLADPKGNGVIYAVHAYPFKGDTVAQWVAKMEKAAETLPLIVSEFGSDPKGARGVTGETWVREVLAALDGHGWAWTAWDLHPQARPCLIADWDYTPTPWFGRPVKESLAGPGSGR